MHPEIKRGGKRSSFYLIINRLFVSSAQSPLQGAFDTLGTTAPGESTLCKTEIISFLKMLHNDQLDVNA